MADLGISRPRDLVEPTPGHLQTGRVEPGGSRSQGRPQAGEIDENRKAEAPEEPAPQELDRGYIEKEVARLNEMVRGRRIRFRIHEETGRVFVEVVDTETDEVIRTVPPAGVLELASKLRAEAGLLVDDLR